MAYILFEGVGGSTTVGVPVGDSPGGGRGTPAPAQDAATVATEVGVRDHSPSVMDNARALIIGIANYEHVRPLPPTVVNDAKDIFGLLTDPRYCGYRAENVELLLNEQASQQGIRQALASLAARSTPDSVVFIYVSSHGGRIESGELAGEYLLPFDASYSSDESLASTSIPGPEFSRAVRAMPARQIVVVFDCCYAAGIKAAKPDQPALKMGLTERFYEESLAGRGRVVIASSRGDEVSNIMPGDGNSLFTKHLLAGLRGGVASEDGVVRVFDLFEYLQPRVTGEYATQHPVFRGELENNFPISFYVGGSKGVVPKADGEFRYHAFISYADSEPDASFVWDTLVPRLESAGVKVAVAEDSEQGGVARVVSAERAIRQSKRTVVVLSDNYLKDRMGEFQNALAQNMGVDEGSYRLLPVKFTAFDESRLPDRIKFLVARNLAHPRRSESQFRRLIEDLLGELPRMDAH